MPKIGIVLSGAASKGAYEIGCINAINDSFGLENIKYISSASIGSLVAECYGLGMLDEFAKLWKSIDTKSHGRFFLSYSGNEDILSQIRERIGDGAPLPFELWVSVWNFTQKKVEYIPFHELSGKKLQDYVCAAISIPFFSKGVTVGNDLLLDGAFLDNIPVYPLVGKDVDYVFCIYFDNYKYVFENAEFDSRIIKLSDFPNGKMLELMTFRPDDFDGMVKYGYDYTARTIDKLFAYDTPEQVYAAIRERDVNVYKAYKPRLTADVVLNNINVMTRRYSKRLTNREKAK